jgi:quinol monooxygenase YgiN
MLAIIATIKVQAGKGAEFEAVFNQLSGHVREKEPGAIVYQLTKSRTEPDTYKVLELYTDQDALAHHGGTDYFKDFGRQMGPFMAGRPEVEILDAVV